MSISLILHISGEEPVIGETDALPEMADIMIKLMNPRRLDGKELSYLADNVTSVVWPLARINFVEIVSTRDEEEIIGFIRER